MQNKDAANSPLKAELQKIRSLPKGKRLGYLWEYYRLAVFLVAFGLFFIFAIGSFLVNGITNLLFPKEQFSIAVSAPGFTANQEWMDDCLTALEYNEKEEVFQLLTCAPLSDTSDDFRINANVWMPNGQPDIFLVNEAGYQYLMELEALAELLQVLPEELLALAADRRASDFALEVSTTPMAEAFGLTGESLYLCIYQHGNGLERAVELVEYILTEG